MINIKEYKCKFCKVVLKFNSTINENKHKFICPNCKQIEFKKKLFILNKKYAIK